jgi:hypothetical protein
VHYRKVDPTPAEVLTIARPESGSETWEVRIPFQSEDLGTPVQGKLVLFLEDGSDVLDFDIIPAGTFDEERVASFSFQVDKRWQLGCHRLEATLVHVGDEGSPDASETVTWLVHIYSLSDEPSTSVSIGDCPRVGDVD